MRNIEKKLIRFIDGLDEDAKEDLLDILNMLEQDPGFTYHKISSIYNRFKWPAEKVFSRVSLIKK